jgi:cobaltochelatase CobS
METTKKFGKIEIPVRESIDNDFVPSASLYIDNKKILETLAYSISENLPTLIIGETGTGKTSAIRYLAHETNNSFRRLNLNGGTTVDELVGKILIKDGSTYWVDGLLIDAMRKGHWILIDEINAGLPEVLFVLQSLLDDDGYIVLADKEDKEIVRPHKDFRLFATMNPAEGYSGTKDLNKALMSRFNLVLTMDFLPLSQELEVMTSKLSLTQPEELKLTESMIKFANALRKNYKNSQLDFVMSTREVYFWIRMTKYAGDVLEGARLSFMAKASAEDREVIEDLLKVHFKTCERMLDEDDFDTPKEINGYVLSRIDILNSKNSRGSSAVLIPPKAKIKLQINTKNNNVRIYCIETVREEDEKTNEAYQNNPIYSNHQNGVSMLQAHYDLEVPITRKLKRLLAGNIGVVL